MDFPSIRKLLNLPEYEPNQGDVKLADRSTGLGIRPSIERDYGDDQYLYDTLRQQNVDSGNYQEPSDEQIKNTKMIMDMAGSTGGITRSMKQLGPQVGKLIDKLAASKTASDIHEPIIKDIRHLRNFKQNPDDFTRIGWGSERDVYKKIGEDPNLSRFIKVPNEVRSSSMDKELDLLKEQLMYNRLEPLGLNPNTRTIGTNEKIYQLQDRVTPIKDNKAIGKIDNPRKEYTILKEENDRIKKTFDSGTMDVGELEKFRRNKDRMKTIQDSDPQYFQRYGLENKMIDEGILPRDMHDTNFGMNKYGNPKVMDVGFFKELDKSTPELQSKRKDAIKLFDKTLRSIKHHKN